MLERLRLQDALSGGYALLALVASLIEVHRLADLPIGIRATTATWLAFWVLTGLWSSLTWVLLTLLRGTERANHEHVPEPPIDHYS